MVHQGGKELLLGGFSDFVEHCQVISLQKKPQNKTKRKRKEIHTLTLQSNITLLL